MIRLLADNSLCLKPVVLYNSRLLHILPPPYMDRDVTIAITVEFVVN